jgi:hypothetical protein
MKWQMSPEPLGSALTPAPPVPQRRAGRKMITSAAVLIVVALVVVVSCGVGLAASIGNPVSETLGSPIRDVPVKTSIVMTEGTYTVYERVSGPEASPALKASSITVRAPDGTAIKVTASSTQETITRNDVTFAGAAKFTVPAANTYKVTVGQVSAAKAKKSTDQVIIGPSLASELGHAVGWIVAIVLGGLILVLGILLLVIGLFRRRQQRSRTTWVAPTPPPPATWHDAPQ